MSSPLAKQYTGSCHCGLTKYMIQLNLPPTTVVKSPPPDEVLIRKCNCTTCHKLSFFHIRLPNPTEQFQLLSPVSTTDNSVSGGLLVGPDGLKDYLCNDRETHWYFCSRCGVRCFSYFGDGQLRSPPFPLVGSGVAEKGSQVRVWTPKENERKDGSSLSVNAATLDAKQEGLDLREWQEKKWIVYLDCLGENMEDDEESRTERPHVGGMY